MRAWGVIYKNVELRVSYVGLVNLLVFVSSAAFTLRFGAATAASLAARTRRWRFAAWRCAICCEASRFILHIVRKLFDLLEFSFGNLSPVRLIVVSTYAARIIRIIWLVAIFHFVAAHNTCLHFWNTQPNGNKQFIACANNLNNENKCFCSLLAANKVRSVATTRSTISETAC